jgi:hypothetical protein
MSLLKLIKQCYGTHDVKLNVVKWLTLVLRIREVQCSNLRTGDQLCSLRFFVVLLSPSRRVPAQYLSLGHDRFLQNPFQFIIVHLSPYHSRYIV